MQKGSLARCLVLAAACPLPALAQLAWRPAQLAGQPEPHIAHDPTRGLTLLYGSPPTLTDTWAWTGTAWTELLPATSPPKPKFSSCQTLTFDSARQRVLLMQQELFTGGGMYEWGGSGWSMRGLALPLGSFRTSFAFDAARQQALAFGGSAAGPGVPTDETWVWNGSVWRQLTPTNKPSPRDFNASLAYDAARARVVLFGGATTSDTWEWDGANWQQMSAAAATPWSPRDVLAYDDSRGAVVRYTPGGAPSVHSWNGTTWTPVSGSGLGPAFASGRALVYDSVRKSLLLCGTNPAPGAGTYNLSSETWELTGTGWVRRWASDSPGSREGHGMVYDSATREVLLVGDYSQFPKPFEPWTWNGKRWQRRVSTTVTPSPRGSCGLANDGSRTIVFGGRAGATVLGEMWQWDGVAWSQPVVTGLPTPRDSPALFFDLVRGKTLLFGGQTSTFQWLSDTWEWDGVAWTQRMPSPAAPALQNPVLTCDITRARMVLVGAPGPTNSLETWLWDGASWSRSMTATPPLGASARLAYDWSQQRVVMVGYSATTSVPETWTWDGTSWSQMPVTAPWNGPIAWDLARARLVTWVGSVFELGPDTPPLVSAFGTGCAGASGGVALSAGTLPWLGEGLVLALAGPGTATPAARALLLGASRTAWGGVPLPLALGFLGMPGCSLHVSLDIALPLADAALALTLPMAPQVIGQAFHAQGIVTDPTANQLGAVSSNALELRIGGR